MVDIYHAPRDPTFERDSKGFSHYLSIWRAISVHMGLSPEPALIVAMDKEEYRGRLPRLLELAPLDVHFEADVKVTFGKGDAEIIKNSLNGSLRRHYARKIDIPVRDIINFPEIDFNGEDDVVTIDPKGVQIEELLDSNIRGNNTNDSIVVLAIESYSNSPEWGEHTRGRLEKDHEYVAAVADLANPWSNQRYRVEGVSPAVEKIIEILTKEEE